MDAECSSNQMSLRYRKRVRTSYLRQITRIKFRARVTFIRSSEVTVCNTVSSLVHVTVSPLETVVVSGTKYLPLLGTEEPGPMETVGHLIEKEHRSPVAWVLLMELLI